MATFHISEVEAASDFASLMARVRAGVEVVIESGALPVAVLSPVEPRRRTLSESIKLAEARTRERGYELTLDAGFAADMEDVIGSRKPRDISAWD